MGVCCMPTSQCVSRAAAGGGALPPLHHTPLRRAASQAALHTRPQAVVQLRPGGSTSQALRPRRSSWHMADKVPVLQALRWDSLQGYTSLRWANISCPGEWTCQGPWHRRWRLPPTWSGNWLHLHEADDSAALAVSTLSYLSACCQGGSVKQPAAGSTSACGQLASAQQRCTAARGMLQHHCCVWHSTSALVASCTLKQPAQIHLRPAFAARE